MMRPIDNIGDAQRLAQAIVSTIPEPFLVLDAELCVVAANRAFFRAFALAPEHTHGVQLYALGGGQWDIPALRQRLDAILAEPGEIEGFEVTHDFPGLGQRTMLLNARRVVYEDSPATTILLAFTDITARRKAEQEAAELLARTQELLRQKQVLLQEMSHRVANSLQIISR
jgi:chemotaxis protein methyltransferase CheR